MVWRIDHRIVVAVCVSSDTLMCEWKLSTVPVFKPHLSPNLLLLRFCLAWSQITCLARTIPPDSLLVRSEQMQPSLKRGLILICHVPISVDTWLHLSSRQEALCNNVWAYHDTAWRPGGRVHNQRFLSNLCDAHTLHPDVQGQEMSFELHQAPRAGAWLTGAQPHPSSIGTPPLSGEEDHRHPCLPAATHRLLCGPGPRPSLR